MYCILKIVQERQTVSTKGINRQSYTLYRMDTLPVILSNHKHLEITPIFLARRYASALFAVIKGKM